METLEMPTQLWIPADGPHAEYVARLSMLGSVSGFSSGEAYHYSLQQGIRPAKKPGDLDLLVDNATFLDAFWLLDPSSRRLVPGKAIELTSTDGAKLSLVADEITGWPHASGEGPEIQIMRPHGPVRCEMPDGSIHFYDTKLDEALAAHNINDGPIPFLQPLAAAMVYAMYQRPLPKMDGHNAFILKQAAQGMASNGAVHKIMETKGFGVPRIHKTLRRLGGITAQPLRRPNLAVAA